MVTLSVWLELTHCLLATCPLTHLPTHPPDSNPNSNHSKGIRSIRMQIRTTRKGFKAFECKFEPLERDSKHSNANSNHSKGIRSIRMQILTSLYPLTNSFTPHSPNYKFIHLHSQPMTNSLFSVHLR